MFPYHKVEEQTNNRPNDLRRRQSSWETRCKMSWDQIEEYDLHSLRHASIREKQGPSLGKIQVEIPHQRSPYQMKFEDISQEETERQKRFARGNAWNLANHIYKLKEKEKAAFYSPSEEWVLPAASTKEPEEREFVVDFGASMQKVSKKDFNSAELETMRISKSPTTVMTANGEVQTREEATVYVTPGGCGGRCPVPVISRHLWEIWQGCEELARVTVAGGPTERLVNITSLWGSTRTSRTPCRCLALLALKGSRDVNSCSPTPSCLLFTVSTGLVVTTKPPRCSPCCWLRLLRLRRLIITPQRIILTFPVWAHQGKMSCASFTVFHIHPVFRCLCQMYRIVLFHVSLSVYHIHCKKSVQQPKRARWSESGRMADSAPNTMDELETMMVAAEAVLTETRETLSGAGHLAVVDGLSTCQGSHLTEKPRASQGSPLRVVQGVPWGMGRDPRTVLTDAESSSPIARPCLLRGPDKTTILFTVLLAASAATANPTRGYISRSC